MDGPRVARPDDLPGIIRLAEHVFCDLEHLPRTMARRFPLLLSEANAENLYVVADAGRPVSLIATDLQTFVTSGCRIPSGLVGAVCTHEAHRGRGHAGRLLELAYERMRAKGVLLVWISGRRRLYLAGGAAPVWPQHNGRAACDRLAAADDPSLETEPITQANLDELAALQRREPARFEWRGAWLKRVPLSWLTPPLGAGWLVRRRGRTVAAVCLCSLGSKSATCELMEWFGDLGAAVAVLGRVGREMGVATIACRVTSYDGATAALMGSAGFEVTRIAPSQRTHKVLDLAGLLRALAPHLERTLGDQAGAVTAVGARLRVAARGSEYVSPDEATAAKMIFALPDEYGRARAEMSPAVRDLVDRAMPVRLRHYGLNYV